MRLVPHEFLSSFSVFFSFLQIPFNCLVLVNNMEFISTYNQAQFVPSVEEKADSQPRRSVSLMDIGALLDSRAGVPLHDQLFKHLSEALENDLLMDVSQGMMPSTRNMAMALGISRETVSKTIAKLSANGFIAANERKRIHVVGQAKNSQQEARIESENASVPTQKIDEDETIDDGKRLDFRPLPATLAEICDYDSNYLVDRYRKTLRRQSSRRQKINVTSSGLLSLRQALAAQLKFNSNIECSADDIVVFPDSRSCLDFVVRLLRSRFVTAVVESPNAFEVEQVLRLNALECVDIPVDEQGMMTNNLQKFELRNSMAVVSPTMQDPTGVTMPLDRKVELLHWARESGSLLVDLGAIQGFVRCADSPSLWQLSEGKDVVCIWEFASILKPWSQMCCVLFPSDLAPQARHLRSIIGGEAALNDQIAMHEFIVEGDWLKTQKHKELLCLEKRRRLNLALGRLFAGKLRAMSMNKGSRMIFEVDSQIDLAAAINAARRVEIPASQLKMLTEGILTEKLLIDLDVLPLESMSEKIEALDCILDVYRSRGLSL